MKALKIRPKPIRRRVRDLHIRSLRAMAAWLNAEVWQGGKLDLPDGTLFPQDEDETALEQAQRWARNLIDCRWDVSKWRENHFEDWKEISTALRLYSPHLILDNYKQALFHFDPVDPRVSVLPGHWWAFTVLVLMNPERDRLGCCDRCTKFYVSHGHYLRKRYCSRPCARNAAVTRYMVKRRRDSRASKLALVQNLLNRWSPRCGDWKRWSMRTAKHIETPLTITFLTRATNRGDITIPQRILAWNRIGRRSRMKKGKTNGN